MKSLSHISQVHQHFAAVDPKIFAVIQTMTFEKLQPRLDDTQFFARLCSEIIGQQLSGKVAEVIEQRLLDLLADQELHAETIVATPEEKLRGVGMSWAKVRSIKDLAAKTIAGELRWQLLKDLDDEAVIAELIKVRGVGRWTAEMFLLFNLGREDVFSFGDLGLKKGLIKLYGLTEEPPKAAIEEITSKWAPFRSYGSLALWHALDNR